MFSTPVLAQAESFDPFVLAAVMIVIVMMVFFGFLLFVLKCYKRCPSNRILVIYGKTKRDQPADCISGGARLVLPLIQDYAWLSLEPIQIEVPLRAVPSAENIRVNVRTVFAVAIGTSPELMQNAAIRLLGLPFAEIEKQATEIIVGQLRQVIASMGIEEIIHDGDKFMKLVLGSLEADLRKLGLLLVNVTITEVTDEAGYIETLSQRATAGALVEKLLERAFEGSALRLVAHLLEEGKLGEEDRLEIRHWLDVADKGE